MLQLPMGGLEGGPSSQIQRHRAELWPPRRALKAAEPPRPRSSLLAFPGTRSSRRSRHIDVGISLFRPSGLPESEGTCLFSAAACGFGTARTAFLSSLCGSSMRQMPGSQIKLPASAAEGECLEALANHAVPKISLSRFFPGHAQLVPSTR